MHDVKVTSALLYSDSHVAPCSQDVRTVPRGMPECPEENLAGRAPADVVTESLPTGDIAPQVVGMVDRAVSGHPPSMSSSDVTELLVPVKRAPAMPFAHRVDLLQKTALGLRKRIPPDGLRATQLPAGRSGGKQESKNETRDYRKMNSGDQGTAPPRMHSRLLPVRLRMLAACRYGLPRRSRQQRYHDEVEPSGGYSNRPWSRAYMM